IIMAITEEGGIGPRMFQQFLLRLGPPEEFLNIEQSDIEGFPRMNPEKIARILNSLNNTDEYIGKIHDYAANEIYVSCILDDDYPESIRVIDDPPPLIYYRGEKTVWSTDFIAMVGTTKATQGGIRLAVDIAKEFAVRGYGIVSGLAIGIDSAAHLGALKEKGANIAVLGNGLLEIYPEENKPLADLITQSGLLISEHPPYDKVRKSGLVLRNRLITALAKAVIVVQVGEETRGELRTASFASKQAKPLFYGDPENNLDYEKVREWPGTIIKTADSVDEIISYIV
ncbi:MAG: DNA-processing protein DprA, partial [candidate division Zixibacteria bacterium]